MARTLFGSRRGKKEEKQMNSHYLFLTIHGHGPNIKERVAEALRTELPECMTVVSDKEFEKVR
jgi:hypothetical protein